MTKAVNGIIIIFLVVVSQLTPAFANIREESIYVDCSNKGCVSYFVKKNKERVELFEDGREPAIIKHNNRLVELRYSCGTYCSYSIFVDVEAERVSQPFENVAAVFPQKNIIVDVRADHLSIVSVFDNKELSLIYRDFSPVASILSVIEEIKFDHNGNLFVRYKTGKNYKVVEEVIKIKLP